MRATTLLLCLAAALCLATPAAAYHDCDYPNGVQVYSSDGCCDTPDYVYEPPTCVREYYVERRDPYWDDHYYYDRSRERRHVRNTLLGIGVANELFNRGSSRGAIRGGVLGGIVLNEVFR